MIDVSQRIAYRGPRPAGDPPPYENEKCDRDDAVNFIVSAAELVGYDRARFSPPIPTGVGYDVRTPVECLVRYFKKACEVGQAEVTCALQDLPESTWRAGKEAVLRALAWKFRSRDSAA